MRRWGTALAASVGALVVIAGCGGGDDNSSSQTAAPAAAETQAQKSYKMTFIPTVSTDPFFITMGCGAKEAAERLNVDLGIQGPPAPDVSKQVAVLNAVMATHPDAILISPGDEKAFNAPLRQAQRDGIKVIFVGKGTSDPSVASGFYSTDEKGGGEQAGELMAKVTGGTGSVMALGGTPVPSLGVRADGFVDAIKQDAPDLKYVGNFYDPSFATDKDTAIVSAQLARHADMSGVYGLYSQQGINAVAAIRGAGKKGKVHVVTFDPTPAVVKDLRNGSIDGIVVQKPGEQGSMGVEQAVKVLDGGQPDSTEHKLGTVLITADNVDTEGAKYLYKDKC